MVNMLREHVPQESRIHYVITEGGAAPNVIPDFAEAYYYVRHPDPEMTREIFDRVVLAARGAAMGTETTVDHEVMGGSDSRLPVESLQRVLHENLGEVGGVFYDEEEQRAAGLLKETLGEAPPLGSEREVQPFRWYQGYASSDNGDVSWMTPMGSLVTATWVPGTAAHPWQAVAAQKAGPGVKGAARQQPQRWMDWRGSGISGRLKRAGCARGGMARNQNERRMGLRGRRPGGRLTRGRLCEKRIGAEPK